MYLEKGGVWSTIGERLNRYGKNKNLTDLQNKGQVTVLKIDGILN